jgi:serine phosphatase RsbU (regulator of sigma subunit)/FixJ family two-component response regulator
MAEASTSKLRLMVVDDELDNLDLLYRTFRRDFEVFKAESATKALQLLEQQEMGIIISDQRMPKMSGTEFLSIAAERFPDTIRILLTGYTDVEDLVGAINAGRVFKYITKPWNPDELKVVVHQAADAYRLLRQRTDELHRALRRESLFNTITTAIRESLDYTSMLQTIVETVGRAFDSDTCVLYPIDSDGLSEKSLPLNYSTAQPLIYQAEAVELSTIAQWKESLKQMTIDGSDQIQQTVTQANGQSLVQLVVPLVYQRELLAIITLYKFSALPWSRDDVALLAEVSEQAALALSQAKLYQQIHQQTEQMRAELEVARQIQTNLLRQSLPKSDKVRIQACCHAARQVGGDFFEVYTHPQGDIWLAVGDVSGKGVPAALFMASAISVLRRELSQEAPPAPDEMMRNLNQILSVELVKNNCFITMVLARYTPSSGQLLYANAGHVYPLVWSHRQVRQHWQDQSAIAPPTYLKTRGVPLGILPVWQAPVGDLKLQSGEILLLVSDGVTEVTVAKTNLEETSTMLHQTGLWQLLLQQQGALNLDRILACIQAHNQIQEDDQTLLSLEVL